MNKSVRNLMIGCGAVAVGMAAMGATSYASTKKMVDVALDRKLPKLGNMEKARESLRGFRDNSDFRIVTMRGVGYKVVKQ